MFGSDELLLTEVLCGVRLHVPPGATCAIVGRSGGGKTTLMNLVLRYYDPTAGRVLLDGDDIATLNPSDYRASIGVVSQETQLFSSSVLDNIAYALEPDEFSAADVVAAAREASAHAFIAAFPDMYHTKVGERGLKV